MRGRVRRGGALLVAGLGPALAALGCGSLPDLDRARRLLERPVASELPALSETPASDLPAPEGLRAGSGELRSVPLQWEPLLVGEVGGYVVERAGEREGEYRRVATLTGRLATAYLDEDAVPEPAPDEDGGEAALDGATFFYRLRAFTPDGRLGEQASPVVVATTAPPPAPPEDLRAYSYQPRQVPLSWRASEDPTVAGYVVDRSPTSVGPFEPIAQLAGRHSTAYVDEGLGDLRVFYFRVAARNAKGGLGEPSEPVRAVTKPEPLPPVDVRVEGQWLGANRVAWEPNVETDVAAYRVLREREGAEQPEIVAEVPGDRTSVDDRELGARERVVYTIVAIDRDGLESDPSVPVSVESAGYELTAIARPDGVHLAWRDRSGEGFARARIFRRAALGQRELGLAENGSFVDTDVKPDARYRYFVVLERPDQTPAPRSQPIEIRIPPR